MRELQGRKESLHALAFTRDNRFLVIGGTAGRVDVWDLANPDAERRRFPKLKYTIEDLWVSPDGEEVVAAEARGRIVARYARATAAPGPVLSPQSQCTMPSPARITPNGTGVVCGERPTRWEFGQTEAVWEAPAHTGGRVLSTAYAITTDDQRLAAGETFYQPNYAIEGHRVCVYEMARNTQPRVFAEVSQPPRCLAWAPGGEHLAAAVGTRVFVWAADGSPVTEFQIPGPKHIIAIVFHPSGRWLAVADNAGAVRLLDSSAWTEARAFEWGLPKARSVCFSPDGTLAAVGSESGKIVVWDVDL